MKRTAIGFLTTVMAGVSCISSAGADEVIPERHDNRVVQNVSPQEGRRLLDVVPGMKGELRVSGGISTSPCLAGPAEWQGDSIRVRLSECDEGEVFEDQRRLPAGISWRTDGMDVMVKYVSHHIVGRTGQLIFPVSRTQPVSLLHLMVSYE